MKIKMVNEDGFNRVVITRELGNKTDTERFPRHRKLSRAAHEPATVITKTIEAALVNGHEVNITTVKVPEVADGD